MSKINDNLNTNNILNKIRSKYILRKIFDNLNEKKILKIILYNKNLLKSLDKRLIDYKDEYSKIEIEIIPLEKIDRKYNLLNIKNNKESSFHIYFNDNQEEIRRKELTNEDKITKIKVIIDSNVKSLENLFSKCNYIKKINISKFNRTDIKSMSYMFHFCTNLEEINFVSFNTDKVTKMNYMFFGCSTLKELYLSNFFTNNVNDFRFMFAECKSLKFLDISNFFVNDSADISDIFYESSDDMELLTQNERLIEAKIKGGK